MMAKRPGTDVLAEALQPEAVRLGQHDFVRSGHLRLISRAL